MTILEIETRSGSNGCSQAFLHDDELWAGVPLFGCFSYVNPATGRNDCWPRFCEALVLPCLLFGTNVTLVTREAPMKYDICRQQPLGDVGACAGVGATFASLCLWWPVSPLFCLLVGHQRYMLRKLYFPRDTSSERWWDFFAGCIFAPCAVYQHYEFLQIDRSSPSNSVVMGAPVQQVMMM